MSTDRIRVKYSSALHRPFGKVFFKNEKSTGEYPIVIDNFTKDENDEIVCILFDGFEFNPKEAMRCFLDLLHRIDRGDIENMLEMKMQESQDLKVYLDDLKWELESREIERENNKGMDYFSRSNFQHSTSADEIKKEMLALDWAINKNKKSLELASRVKNKKPKENWSKATALFMKLLKDTQKNNFLACDKGTMSKSFAELSGYNENTINNIFGKLNTGNYTADDFSELDISKFERMLKALNDNKKEFINSIRNKK